MYYIFFLIDYGMIACITSFPSKIKISPLSALQDHLTSLRDNDHTTETKLTPTFVGPMRGPSEIGLQSWPCKDNTQNLIPKTAVAVMPSSLNLDSKGTPYASSLSFALSVQRYLPSAPTNIFGVML